MNKVFKKDLYRYYDEDGVLWSLKYISAFRKANMYKFLPSKFVYIINNKEHKEREKMR